MKGESDSFETFRAPLPGFRFIVLGQRGRRLRGFWLLLSTLARGRSTRGCARFGPGKRSLIANRPKPEETSPTTSRLVAVTANLCTLMFLNNPSVRCTTAAGTTPAVMLQTIGPCRATKPEIAVSVLSSRRARNSSKS